MVIWPMHFSKFSPFMIKIDSQGNFLACTSAFSKNLHEIVQKVWIGGEMKNTVNLFIIFYQNFMNFSFALENDETLAISSACSYKTCLQARMRPNLAFISKNLKIEIYQYRLETTFDLAPLAPLFSM